MSSSGIVTRIWGPPAWIFLHSIVAGYPVNPDEYDTQSGNIIGHTRQVYKSFFTNVGGVLPCGLCRNSYVRFLEEVPIDDYIHSREALFEWLFIIHNKVNEKLGVDEEEDLSTIVAKYESYRAKCPKKPDAKGCVIPAGRNKKMKCRIVIESVECKMGIIKGIAGSMLVMMVIILIRTKTKST